MLDIATSIAIKKSAAKIENCKNDFLRFIKYIFIYVLLTSYFTGVCTSAAFDSGVSVVLKSCTVKFRPPAGVISAFGVCVSEFVEFSEIFSGTWTLPPIGCRSGILFNEADRFNCSYGSTGFAIKNKMSRVKFILILIQL